MKRADGRKPDELRPIEAKVGVIKRADGSAMFKIGKTVAIAAVYGPRGLFPAYLRNSEVGIMKCNYNMMSFSGSGERVRPGPSRRSKEISLVMEKALLPVVMLSNYPNTVIEVFVELLQTDAGTRCAAITAASMALADAGVMMKDLVSAVAVGLVDGSVVVDLSKEEEDVEDACDMPVAMTARNSEITLLQLDGVTSKKGVLEALELAKKACKHIHDVQTEALKAKYKDAE